MNLNRRAFLSRLPFLAGAPLTEGQAPPATFAMSAYGASAGGTAQANAGAFYRALDAAQRAGGVVLVDGRYAVSNLILDGQHQAALKGMGRGASALIGGTGDDALLSVVRSESVEARDLDLETQGVAAVYGLTSAGLHLENVNSRGGRMAGLFLDRCDAPNFRHVRVRDVLMHSPGVGGAGIWWMRGGTQGRMADIRVEEVDGDGIRLDASSNDGLPATIPTEAALMGLYINGAGRVTDNAAAVMLEGASNCMLTSLHVARMRGHGLVLQQDQSGAIPTGNVIHTGLLLGLTGYAVALLGAQRNDLAMLSWDGSGAGKLLQAPGLGGNGAPSEFNTVQISGPGRQWKDDPV